VGGGDVEDDKFMISGQHITGAREEENFREEK